MENNFREILILIEQIDVLKALLRDLKDGIHNHSWSVPREAVQDKATTEVLDEARWSGAWRGVSHLAPECSFHFFYQLTLAMSSETPDGLPFASPVMGTLLLHNAVSQRGHLRCDTTHFPQNNQPVVQKW